MSDDLPDDWETMIRSDRCPEPMENPQWASDVVAQFSHETKNDIWLKITVLGRCGKWIRSDTYGRLENWE